MTDERVRNAARAAGMPLDDLEVASPPTERGSRVELGRGDLALRTGDHAAFIYWDPKDLLAMAVPYLVEGLRAGDKVVYVADDLTIAELEQSLVAAGVDVKRESAQGNLALTTATAAFFPNGTFDLDAALAGVGALASSAVKDGFRRVRFSVEMTYLLAKVPGIERGPEFESRANEEVFAKLPFVCVCSFNTARDLSNTLVDVLRTHPVLIHDGVPLANPYYRAWAELRTEPGRLTRRTRRTSDAQPRSKGADRR